MTFLGTTTALTLALSLTACASSPVGDIDALSSQFDRAVAQSTTAADAQVGKGAASLILPVRDHLSAVQYCAFFLRALGTTQEAKLADVRRRAELQTKQAPPPGEAVKSIPWGDLFPTVRDAPDFDIRAGGVVGGPEVFISYDTGVCAILTRGEPGAASRATAWLSSRASGWRLAGRQKGWQAYRIQNPTPLEADLAVFEPHLSERARRAGVDGVTIVAMTGLP